MAKKAFVSAALLLSSCALAWGQTGTYSTGDNTVEITANNSTLTINVTGDATAITGIDKNIETAILAGNYSTITVAGGQINSKIVHSILYQNISTDPNPNNVSYKKNEALTTIDLGTTTVTDFDTNTFKYDNVWQGNCNLETITLPLATRDADGKMTVPLTVLSFTTFNTQSKVKTVIVPEGYTNIGERAFYGFNNGVNFDFTISLPTSLKAIDTEAFFEVKNMKDITLPEGLVTIGKRAFKTCESLTAPKFPSTLKEILSEAYSGSDNIKNIKFNEGIEFIGNCAFYCNHAVTECQPTITFPSTLKYMGPGAFYGRRFEEIYFNSVTAPISPIGQLFSDSNYYLSAFEGVVNMGNDGFNPNKGEISDDAQNLGFANRENYKNHGVYFTMLHFPKIEDIGEANAETYTDITREYVTKYNPNGTFSYWSPFEVGKEKILYSFNGYSLLDGENIGKVNPGYIDTYRGEQYIWPSQTQWRRSYVCNSLGYKWDGVTKYRPDITEDQIALMIKDGLTIKNAGTITESNKDEYADELSKTAYMGTRQFVLVDADHEASNEYPIDVKGGQWWTLCVPFNMTKKQIDDVFGSGTHVCLFSDVERYADGLQKKITLKFVHDVYAHKTVKDDNGKYATNFKDDAPACGDDDIVIYAHESYMIHPTKTDDDAVFVVNNYEPIAGSPLPTIVKANDGTEYRFIGNYTTKMGGDETVQMQRIRTVTIPQYSYMYAKKKGDEFAKFWFYSGTTMAWKANKSVVQATAKDGGTTDFHNFFGDPTSQAKQFSVFGSDDLDDKPTEIEHVEIIAGEQPQNGIKYDLYGRRVSDNYKGIYIMNGKKYINR